MFLRISVYSLAGVMYCDPCPALQCDAANIAAPTLFVSTIIIGGTGNVSPMYWWN
jgi:hypothetical protein